MIPSSQSVDVTHTATFYAVARGVGNDMFTYQWRKGRRNIHGANGPILTISNIKRGDAGFYRCDIENKNGDTVVSGHVHLLIASKYVTQSMPVKCFIVLMLVLRNTNVYLC